MLFVILIIQWTFKKANLLRGEPKPGPPSRAEALQAGGWARIFTYNCKSNDEKRVFHKENFHAKDLDLNTENKQLVCSQTFPNGTSNILLMNEDGSDLHEITKGDSLDEAPSWIPGK